MIDFPLRSRNVIALLLLVVVGCAMHIGGAHPWAVPVWASVSLAALLVVGVNRADAADPLARALGLGVAVAALQLVPLPPFLLGLFDSSSATSSAGALAPLGADRAGSWRAFSMDPGNTRADVQYLVGILAAYLAATHVARRGHARGLLAVVEWATLWIAVVSVAHRYWNLHKVYGLYEPREAHPALLSPLLNANHLSIYLGIGAILWLGRALSVVALPARIVAWTATVVCGSVSMIAMSRGGSAATLGGMVLLALATVRLRKNHRRRRGEDGRSREASMTPLLVTGAALAVVVYGTLSLLRIEFGSNDTTKLAHAVRTVALLRSHGVFGAGAGALHAAVSAAGVFPGGVTFERVESMPLDLLLAFGIPTTLALAWYAVRWVRSVAPTLHHTPMDRVAPFCAVVAVAVHDLVDFSLWLGATGYACAVMAGALSGTRRRESDEVPMTTSLRLPVAVALAASVAVATTVANGTLAVDRQNLLAMRSQDFYPGAMRPVLLRHPGDPFIPLRAGTLAYERHDRTALRFFARSMNIAPRWSEPHRILAELMVRHGRRPQGIVEMHEALVSDPGAWGRIAALLADISPTSDEILRVAPRGPEGLGFLQAMGNLVRGQAAGEQIDAAILQRAPDDLTAMAREATRAAGRGDDARAEAIYARMMRTDAPEGYLGMAALHANRARWSDARVTLENGLRRVPDDRSLLRRLAYVLARLRIVPEMRRTYERVLESAGADIDLRVEILGEQGRSELLLDNLSAALTAFERGDAMGSPQHPYLRDIIGIVARIGDLGRLRAACDLLQAQGNVQASERAQCEPAYRALPSGPASTM